MPSTIRTFIALELPPSIVSLLANMQKNLQSMGVRAKWVRPQNIHLTLKFLGNINPGDIEKIGESMADAVAEFDALNLVAEGIGVFPGIHRPRVIWVGLKGQVQTLFALQRRMEDNLAALGYKKEKRPFKGHLTLGRFRNRINTETIRRVVGDSKTSDSEAFTAKRVILYKSDLKPTGAVYSQLQQAVLE